VNKKIDAEIFQTEREEIEERRMPVLRFDGIRKDNLDNRICSILMQLPKVNDLYYKNIKNRSKSEQLFFGSK
jgi:hypothetical protein